jgi:hypothetical protein
VTLADSGPAILPFPGYPAWSLFFCTCWLERMPGGKPQLPAHIEAALTVERPRDGHVVSCGVGTCRSTWVFREASKDWLRLLNDVEVPMSGAIRRNLYREGRARADEEAEISMSAARRRDLFEEGTVNEILDADSAAGDTEADFSAQ